MRPVCPLSKLCCTSFIFADFFYIILLSEKYGYYNNILTTCHGGSGGVQNQSQPGPQLGRIGSDTVHKHLELLAALVLFNTIYTTEEWEL
jgi:hypothetical protein